MVEQKHILSSTNHQDTTVVSCHSLKVHQDLMQDRVYGFDILRLQFLDSFFIVGIKSDY